MIVYKTANISWLWSVYSGQTAWIGTVHTNNQLLNRMQHCFWQESEACDDQYKYRMYDGSCNNLRNPSWGKTSALQNRIVDTAYDDGNNHNHWHHHYHCLCHHHTTTTTITTTDTIITTGFATITPRQPPSQPPTPSLPPPLSPQPSSQPKRHHHYHRPSHHHTITTTDTIITTDPFTITQSQPPSQPPTSS